MFARAIVILSLFWATPLRAELSCLDVFALTRLVDVSHTSGAEVRSVGNLLSDIDRIDRDFIEAHRESANGDTLTRFALLANTLGGHADNGNITGVLAALRVPHNFRVLIDTMDVLVAQGCDEIEQSAPSSAASSDTSDHRTSQSDITTKAIQARVTREEVVRISLFGLLVAAVLIAVFWLTKFLIQHRQTVRRRGKRYMCAIDVTLHDDDRSYDCKLLDISCYGAKVGHKAAIDVGIGRKITAHIAGKPRPATVAWINEHFVGINFATRLRSLTVLDLVGKSSMRRTPKKNGARKRRLLFD